MKEKFIPRGRLGKKARRLADTARRRTWDCSPVSRVMESRKVYNRSRIADRSRNDDGGGFFYFWQSRARRLKDFSVFDILMPFFHSKDFTPAGTVR